MKIDFQKFPDGLVPTIVQDVETRDVLMLGYMSEASLEMTRQSGIVTFFSRSRQELWTKGERSGNFLEVRSLKLDCDSDAILIEAMPAGPVCHTGSTTCFGEPEPTPARMLARLEGLIDERRESNDSASYVASLFRDGINRIAQKVGEEAVELVIEAKDANRERITSEAADLLFHYLILLRATGVSLGDVTDELHKRRK